MSKQNTDDKAETIKGDGAGAANDDEKSRSGENDNAEPDTNANELAPGGPKIGEGPGNLKRRSEWFQKRHGRG